MKKIIVAFIALFLIFPFNVNKISNGVSNENKIILVSNDNPFYSLIATALSFHEGKIPILLFNEKLDNRHKKFIKLYNANEFIIIGKHIELSNENEFTGNAINISFEIAKFYYEKSNKILLLPYNDYNLSLIATPISCYLDIPIILYKNNSKEIKNICNLLKIKEIISIGNISIGKNETRLKNESQIYNFIESIEKLDYIAVANPNDVINPYIKNESKIELEGNIMNLKLILFSIEFNLVGNDEKIFYINVPNGINYIEIYVNVSRNDSLPYIIFSTLYDENGKMVTYSNSLAYDFQKCYMQALSINHSGNYKLKIKIYHGIKSGYFIQRGISFVNTKFKAAIKIKRLLHPHFPLLHISKLAPFLACSHNGIVFMTKNEITSNEYKKIAMAGGAWNNAYLQSYVNEIVNKTVIEIKKFNKKINARWLAIVGDTNMIPMYYYASQNNDSFVGLGIPSDNPYFLNFSIAVGRIVAFDDIDVSLLISRSIFYNKISHGSWMDKFTFIFGEGFGETGGIFHQIPYSKIVGKKFKTKIYGDFRNSRQMLEKMDAFNASYIEYEGHGDWFWMFANIYTNYYDNVDSSHLKHYNLNPSIILTAACLMARIDGVPLNENIGLAFIHAGAVTFIGATRETWKEAELEIIENNLIKNDTSIGEALRIAKIHDKMPTKVARVLYGDPAFNPYEP